MSTKWACPECGCRWDSDWEANNCCVKETRRAAAVIDSDEAIPTNLEKNRVLGSSRLTSFWSDEEKRTVTVTVLFWSDGSVTWAKE